MSIELKSPKEAHYTVYMLTSPENKVYIGCTGQRVRKRWDNGRGYKCSAAIREAIEKYGWESFRKTILCEKLPKELGEALEKWFVEYYDSTNPEKGYNRFTGGSRKNASVCEESKNMNRETKLKFLEGNTEFSLLRREIARDYYERNPEARAKIAEKMHDYLLSPEGRKFPQSSKKAKPVLCVETGVIYPSAYAAERETGFGSIHKVCAGKEKTSGGYHWRYVQPAEQKNQAGVSG